MYRLFQNKAEKYRYVSLVFEDLLKVIYNKQMSNTETLLIQSGSKMTMAYFQYIN